jgi:hypothetical protein
MWLLGFVPIQHICAAVFLPRAAEEFRQLFGILLGQSEVFHEAATRLREVAAGDCTAKQLFSEWDHTVGFIPHALRRKTTAQARPVASLDCVVLSPRTQVGSPHVSSVC